MNAFGSLPTMNSHPIAAVALGVSPFLREDLRLPSLVPLVVSPTSLHSDNTTTACVPLQNLCLCPPLYMNPPDNDPLVLL